MTQSAPIPAGGLFTSIFVPDPMQAVVCDRAWLQAMLDVEAALAAAEARAGVIPAEAAQAIAASCIADRFDPDAIGRAARASASPVVPLVRALTDAVPGDAAGYVHWGATSQDVLDTAAMLVARRALDLILADLDAAAAACAELAQAHRSTVMAGRSLLQQALPITFGLKAARWLVAIVDGRRRLASARSELAVSLGGAAGTLAALGDHGLDVLRALADELGLAEPVLPWHTDRTRVADLGAALAITAGTLAKLALDVALLAQTEVAEVAEPAGDGRGGSSTLPHKRNPVGAVVATACARRVQAASALLIGSMAQEHERAAGAWQAEWEALRDALALTGGASAAMAEVVGRLEVRSERMRHNLDATGGLLLAEHVMIALGERVGRGDAHGIVEAASRRAIDGRRSLRDELLDDPAVTAELSVDEVDRALEPAGYLGATDVFIDRALEHCRRAGSR